MKLCYSVKKSTKAFRLVVSVSEGFWYFYDLKVFTRSLFLDGKRVVMPLSFCILAFPVKAASVYITGNKMFFPRRATAFNNRHITLQRRAPKNSHRLFCFMFNVLLFQSLSTCLIFHDLLYRNGLASTPNVIVSNLSVG